MAPRGTAHMAMLADLLEEEEMASSLPQAARAMLKVMTDLMTELDGQVGELDKEIARRARLSRRAVTSPPGLGSRLSRARPRDRVRLWLGVDVKRRDLT